jgi:integrase
MWRSRFISRSSKATSASRKRRRARSPPFSSVSDGSTHRAGWRSAKHGLQWTTSLTTYAYPRIGNLDVAKIDLPAVLAVLEQKVPAQLGYPAGRFWDKRVTTADRVRNRLEAILNFAAIRGHRSKTEPNPASWKLLKDALPAPKKVASKVHHPAVPYSEIPSLMAALAERAGVGPQALRFLIMTAARAGEVTAATWDEIDFASATWTIPGQRMKGGREHKVLLAPQAVELLQSCYREDDNLHLFIRISNAVLDKTLKRLGRRETIHGMRSTFSTWAAERTRFDSAAVEISLAHTVGSEVAKAYQRGDLIEKRRRLMAAWAEYCTSPLTTADIVPLRGGA